MLAGGHRHQLDHTLVREHTRYSWFTDTGPRHPWHTVVTPDRSRAESYSWATAPRYGDQDLVMQLGPLPELLLAGDPLAASLVAVHGTSAWVRQLVRWTRAAANLALIRQWLNDLASGLGQPTLRPPRPADTDPDAPGFGRANATRGTPSGTCSSTSSGSGSTDSTHAGEDLANDSTLPQRARLARCLKDREYPAAALTAAITVLMHEVAAQPERPQNAGDTEPAVMPSPTTPEPAPRSRA